MYLCGGMVEVTLYLDLVLARYVKVERLAYRRRVGKNEVLITEREAERRNLID